MNFAVRCLLVCGLCLPIAAQTVTQLHSYGEADPDLVERQIRALVPEEPRVSMNRNARQVIVVAEPEVQEKIAGMVKQLSTPPLELRFRIRHNRDVRSLAVRDGIPFSLPISETPPPELIRMARGRLNPERRNLPVVGSALQLHPKLLREDPAIVRLRVTPAVVFGHLQPYDVVSFEEVTQDVLVNTEVFLDLTLQLGSHHFYEKFLRTLTEPASAPKPVALLLSLQVAPVGSPP